MVDLVALGGEDLRQPWRAASTSTPDGTDR
jgi:hypothetical protein